MQKYAALFAASLGLALFFYVPSAPEPYDPGGNVIKYYKMVQAANRSKSRTFIAGTCASACTQKLGIKNVCIYPDAKLLFHQASHTGPTIKSEAGNKILMSLYPKNIKNWVLRNKALNSPDLTAMSGKEAISMGVRPCRIF